MAIRKSELYSSLWASCDELRAGMDASQYKDYVLVLLFLKHISDKYAGQPLGGDHLYVTSKNIRKGFTDLRDVEHISAAEHEKIYRRCAARRGELLLTKDGANNENTALANIHEEFSLLSSVAMLRFDERRHDAAYSMYQLLSTAGQAKIQEALSGNAITILTLAKIRDLQFQAPQVSEQVAISDMLLAIDHEISVATSKRTKASLLKQAMMLELLPGRIRLR